MGVRHLSLTFYEGGGDGGTDDIGLELHTEFGSMSVSTAGGRLTFDDAALIVRVLCITFLTAPRMLLLAIAVHRRGQRLSQMDRRTGAKVLSLLMKKQGRVTIDDVVAELPDDDPKPVIRSVLDFDGVVLLQKDGFALTLAPPVIEDFNDWTPLD